MTATTADHDSDVDLLLRARAGDDAADARLLARHRDAVAALGDSPAFSSVEASGRTALALLRQGADGDLPFRAVWLALHAQGRLPEHTGSDVVWSGFLALPTAWRTALWHREVEGARLGEIARLLDMGEQQATRALVSAYASLKRRIALAHPAPEATGFCAELRDTYRFAPPATLPAAEVRALREHGRHCDECLGLIRDLLLVEHTLRTSLATAVLGAAADGYLARRPRPGRLRTPATEVVHRERRVRPILATLSATSIGAAATALVLSTPAISPARDTPRDLYAASVPAPGQNLWPAVDAMTSRERGPASAADLGPVRPVAGGTPAANDDRDGDAPGQQGQQGQQPGDAPEPGVPAVPVEPALPTEPSVPSEPTPEPAPEPDGDGVSLGLTVEEGAATVQVDPQPGPSAPIEIEVPLPDEELSLEPGDLVEGVL